MHLRSVELQMPGRAVAAEFLKAPWGLLDAGTRGETTYLRGTAPLQYVIAVTEGPVRAVLSATLIGTRQEVEAVWERVRKAGLKHGPWVDEFDEPGRGAGCQAPGPAGEPPRRNR